MSVKLVQQSKPSLDYLIEITEGSFDVDGYNEVTAEQILVHIARVSSSRSDTFEEPSKLINYLIRNNHWSPFEHSYFTFEIITSLPIATQYLRHRSFVFQQFSQRYAAVSEVENVEFRLQADENRQSSTDILQTIEFRSDDNGDPIGYDLFINNDLLTPDQRALIAEAILNIETSFIVYKKLINNGIAKETARMILPQCSQTRLYMTGNIRSWIHLIQLREDSHAQKEAQEIATEIKKILINEIPITAKALNWV